MRIPVFSFRQLRFLIAHSRDARGQRGELLILFRDDSSRTVEGTTRSVVLIHLGFVAGCSFALDRSSLGC